MGGDGVTKQPNSILDDPGVQGLLLSFCRAMGVLLAYIKKYYKERSDND